jgi:catechol 2,3-dioxygenase-like lactoylglutathione lyase family enzyme
MLTNAHVTTMLPVINMKRARDFYENKLGLQPEGERPNGQFLYKGGDGATIALYPREEPTKAEHTALSFEVDDIESEVSTLESKGVVFEDYDLPNLKTDHHVCVLGSEKAAWFKDTEGNYLCIHEDTTAH